MSAPSSQPTSSDDPVRHSTRSEHNVAFTLYQTIPNRGELAVALSIAGVAFLLTITAAVILLTSHSQTLFAEVVDPFRDPRIPLLISVALLIVSVVALFRAFTRRRGVLRSANLVAMALEQTRRGDETDLNLLVAATVIRNKLIDTGNNEAAERLHRAIMGASP